LTVTADLGPARPGGGDRAQGPAIEVEEVSRRFGRVRALESVSLAVRRGEIHALLGPNGAGKTTLLRVLTGLVEPDEGAVRVLGREPGAFASREFRRLLGLIPSGDRTFYLRISGLENLIFFGRLYGLSKAAARERAWELLEAVELAAAGRQRVGVYSHGMQKRLSVARALLMDPPILLVDEATHDLDPDGARRTRRLVGAAAERGAAVVWATQRLDEIRGFAHRVTLLAEGCVRFSGTVPELMATAASRRYLLQVDPGVALLGAMRPLVSRFGDVLPAGDDGHVVLILREEAVLGEAIAALWAAGVRVLACREERSMVEDAFLRLTGGDET
jgi:ABC-2 type transport system ATP-binding protein